VIRRGRDGTATLVLRGANGLQRRILFVQGKATATDAMQAATSSRTEDVITVEIGDDRYVFPVALLTGG